MSKDVLILERSTENLKKLEQGKKTTLEGVFAEFGVENRNGRVYEEKEYLPHLEYLKKDMNNGSLLGELDHPERFEVALGNVSHRVNELWYDEGSRQIKGRIEVLDTPKGQVAKNLLDAGVPLSISSRAAGTVNEDKTVSIQQIYTYDLVAKPGFEAAQLHTINEAAGAKINKWVKQLNESHDRLEKESGNKTTDLGIINENVSIYEINDKPKIEAKAIEAQKKARKALGITESKENKNENQMNEQSEEKIVQQWTIHFNNELTKLTEKLNQIESAILEGKVANPQADELAEVKKVQEGLKTWMTDMAKAVNKVGNHTQKLTEKTNANLKMTNKLVETVDYNAKALNHTQDWVGENAKVVNVVAETVDHNAKMLNGINEWNGELAQGINKLNEWGEEKAKAINSMHEWTGTIAKGLNQTATYVNETLARSMTKDDAGKLVEYIEIVSEGKEDAEFKSKLEEAISTNNKTLAESVKGLETITDVKTVGNKNVDVDAGKDTAVHFDGKTIVAKIKKSSLSKGNKPKELDAKKIDVHEDTAGGGPSAKSVKGVMVLDTTKTATGKPSVQVKGDGPSSKMVKDQKLKLDQKPAGKMNESGFEKSSDINDRSNKLFEKLGTIVDTLEADKKKVNESREQYPFVKLLSESDQKTFSALSESEKQKINKEFTQNPTSDSETIKRLWESALASEKPAEEPVWLKTAPAKFKKLYESADEGTKGAINARAEYMQFPNQYAIDHFWTVSSGLSKSAPTTLNEVVTANGKSIEQVEESDYDQTMNNVFSAMGKYNN